MDRNNKGKFVKGMPCSEEKKKYLSLLFKGKPLSEEHKKKISEAHIKRGTKPVCGYRKGCISSNKGKNLTEEHKKNISESQKGEKGYWYGKKVKIETLIKLSDIRKGEKHWNWKGGISNNLERINTIEWNIVRRKVYARDNYTCQVCGKKNPRPLQCHHKIPYSITQDDSIDNLITLCCSCHTKEENKYYKDNKWRYKKSLDCSLASACSI